MRSAADANGNALATKRARLEEARNKLDRAKENMALANSEPQYRAIAEVFERLQSEHESLEAEVREAEGQARVPVDIEAEVAAALSQLERLPALSANPEN